LIQEIIEIIVQGTISSGVYALLALGFTLIYGIAGIVNLAHGSFYMLGAYMFFVLGIFFSFLGGLVFLETNAMLISISALVFAIIIVAIIGSLVYKLAISPVLGNEIAVIVVTVCLALIFQQIILFAFGATFPPVKWPPGSILNRAVDILGIQVQWSKILAFIVSIALFGILLLFIRMTKLGMGMRAVSQDREAAMLMGINTERLYVLTMAISAIFASTASILITASTTLSAGAWMWLHPLAMSFSIVILGGLGSIKGSLIGGFILGYAEKTVAILVPEGGGIIGVIPLLVMVLVLLLRPKGLFGKRVEMED
jgi:branched-chain amino acid transport system permease protein